MSNTTHLNSTYFICEDPGQKKTHPLRPSILVHSMIFKQLYYLYIPMTQF